MDLAVAVCGPIGSGKSTATAFVAHRFGLEAVSFGQYIRHLARLQHLPTDRANLQKLGQCVFTSKGPTGLLQDVLAHFQIENRDSVVFDGVRHPEVLVAIRRFARTTIAVYLDVHPGERFRRHRSRESSDLSLHDHQDFDAHLVESGSSRLIHSCDFVLDAARTAENIHKTLAEIITRSASV